MGKTKTLCVLKPIVARSMETVMDMMDVFAAVYQSSLENTIQAIQLKLQSDPDAKDLVS